jgi:tRNA(Ile)-lysidine synthase
MDSMNVDSAGILRYATPKLLKELTRPRAPARGESVLCAVSGGADSVALACLLSGLAPGRGWSLTLASVEHGMRGSSGASDAASVEGLAAKLELPCRILRAELAPGSPEAAARDARHRLLSEAARSMRASAVAFAHTMDDQAETLLHRLTRGAGSAGLGAMSRWSGERWRPLLRVRRATLRSFLETAGVPWQEDETNLAPEATRNRLRHVALPALESAARRDVVPALCRAAELLAADEALLSRLADEASRDVVLDRREEGVECDLPKLAALEAPLRSRVLRRLLGDPAMLEGELTRAHVEALERLVTGGGHGTHLDLPGLCIAKRRGRRLFLARIPAPPDGG